MAVEPGSRGRIIVFGILFWYPLAGVTYQFLHYLLALRRLGYDPYYIEDSGRWVYDPLLNDLSPDAARQCRGGGAGARGARLRRPLGVSRRLPGRPLLRHDRGRDPAALPARPTRSSTSPARRRSARSTCACPRRIYVESDPFASQVKVANGEAGDDRGARGARHAFHVRREHRPARLHHPGRRRIAGCRRASRCSSICGGTRYPAAGAPYTTITTWHNKGKDVDATTASATTGPRTASSSTSSTCRSAGRARSSWPSALDDATRQRLTGHGLAPAPVDRPVGQRDRLSRLHPALARRVHRGPRPVRAAAHRLVQRSHAPATWRAGRPVITQDTGFGKFLPTGRGLFAFTHDGRRPGRGRRDRERLRRTLPRRAGDRASSTSAPSGWWAA